MEILDVPFVRQLTYHCGPVALEMVYKYNGLNNISQEELFKKIPKQKDSLGNPFILVKDLVADAKERSFESFIFDFRNYPNKEIISMTRSFIECGIPVISCGQWKKDRSIGHFRVILKIDDEHVFFHDPDLPNNKGYTKYTHDSFLSYWKSRGSFIGNIGFGVYKKDAALPTNISSYPMIELT